jgi:hypothetical protein
VAVAIASLIGDPHGNEIGGFALAEAALGAPSEHHAGNDPARG